MASVKDTEDKNHWLVDEAAEAKRKIFRLTVEGMGPYQIAKRLMEEKVEKPSYYQATRQRAITRPCAILKPLQLDGRIGGADTGKTGIYGRYRKFRSHKGIL